MNNPRIHLSLATMGGEEQRFVQEAFDTNWIAPLGPNVDGFEQDLAGYLGGGKPVAALSSGTAALHLALLLLGVKRGDEVICQSFTFAATANPITYLGATPVFVDSEPETWNMSPQWLEKAIQDRLATTGKVPKAIVAVDLYGMPAKWDEICAIADRYGIPVVEDAAEALGSSFRGRKCGTYGQFGILSFNGNKIITTSGGGALVCPSAEMAKEAVFLATQARDPAPHYQHSEIGYNYRMSNICAGIGRGQMLALDRFVARRRAIHALYTERLADAPGITVMQAPAACYDTNYWLTTILVGPAEAGRSREEIREALEANGIESRPLWKPMHLQPVFRHAPFYGDGTSEGLFERGLCLPSGAGLTDEDVARVAAVVCRTIKDGLTRSHAAAIGYEPRAWHGGAAAGLNAARSRRVLVIDDDPAWGASVVRILAGVSGITVATATDGAAGFAMARRQPPDLILLDVRMPGRDGFAVLWDLKRTPETRGVSVVMVTALDDAVSRQSALSAEADDYVTKPVPPARLRDLVSSW